MEFLGRKEILEEAVLVEGGGQEQGLVEGEEEPKRRREKFQPLGEGG